MKLFWILECYLYVEMCIYEISTHVQYRPENCRKFFPANRRHHNWGPYSSKLQVDRYNISYWSVRICYEPGISQYSLIWIVIKYSRRSIMVFFGSGLASLREVKSIMRGSVHSQDLRSIHLPYLQYSCKWVGFLVRYL